MHTSHYSSSFQHHNPRNHQKEDSKIYERFVTVEDLYPNLKKIIVKLMISRETLLFDVLTILPKSIVTIRLLVEIKTDNCEDT